MKIKLTLKNSTFFSDGKASLKAEGDVTELIYILNKALEFAKDPSNKYNDELGS